MIKHYKTAVLLIEFEGDRAFALHVSGELRVARAAHAQAVEAGWRMGSGSLNYALPCPAPAPHPAAPRCAGGQRDWRRRAAAQPDGAHRAARAALPAAAPHLVALAARHRPDLPSAQVQPGGARPGGRWGAWVCGQDF